jgi:hypothetical protein
MTDPVSRLARALGALRKERVRNEARKPSGDRPHTAEGRSATGSARAKLAARVSALDLATPGSRDAAVTLLLEHMLGQEFGAEAMRTATMQQTLRDVQRVMDADPSLRTEIDELLDSLRTS